MCHRWVAAWFILVLLPAPAGAREEPTLADTTERLTVEEEKAARSVVLDSRPTTADWADFRTLPPHPVLVVPKELEALYRAKPKATVRFLLKIVEAGRAGDSIHAASCLLALAESPVFGGMFARGAEGKTWDDAVGKDPSSTPRENARRVCIRFIAEKEQGTPAHRKK